MANGRRSGVKDRNVAGDALIKSWKSTFAYAGASPTAINLGISALFDGLIFYDTANSNLRIYDSGWSTFASSGGVAGTIDDILGTGSKATTNGNMEIEVTDASNYLLTLDAGGAGGCLALENNSTGDSLSIDDGGTVWCQVGLAGAKDLQISNAGFISMLDNTLIKIGTGDDFTFKFDATDLLVEAGTADLIMKFGATTNFDLIIYGDTATDLITFDTSAELVHFNGFDLQMKDSDRIAFGDAAGGDVWILWDGTNLTVDCAADDSIIEWGDGTNSFDQKWYGAAATDLITLDASANLMTVDDIDFNFTDNTVVSFGTGKDITVTFDATDLIVDGPAADLIIKIGATSNQDIIIYGDTASDLITFDTSAELVHFDGFDLQMKDDDIVSFGDGKDVTVTFDATDLIVDGPAADIQIKVGATNNLDLIIYGDTATDLITFDTSAELVTFNGFDLNMMDADQLRFGDLSGGDINIEWDGTDLLVEWGAADTGIMKFGFTTNGDIAFYGDTNTDLVYWDTSAELMYLDGFDLQLKDSDILQFGDAAGGDVSMRWDATDLDVLCAADDSVLKFGDGTQSFDVWTYGNVAGDYLLWDASASKLSVEGAAHFALEVGAKTAAYTVTTADFSQVFTNRGDVDSITFTLPAASGNSGAWVEFVCVADQEFVVAAQAGELVTFNNAAATSITFTTATEHIGAAVRTVCDGTSWLALIMAEETQSFTVA